MLPVGLPPTKKKDNRCQNNSNSLLVVEVDDEVGVELAMHELHESLIVHVAIMFVHLKRGDLRFHVKCQSTGLWHSCND